MHVTTFGDGLACTDRRDGCREDEGCEMLYAMRSRGFNVVIEKITRTRKRRQRNTA